MGHVKRRQPLNEEVFEAGALCFSVVSFKRWYDEYLLWYFFTFCWSLNLLLSFSLPRRDCKSLSVCSYRVCVCLCEYIYWIKTSLKLSFHFFQCLFQKMVEWVAFKVSLRFLLKFKPFKMWQPMSLFMLLRLILRCVWKVIPCNTGKECPLWNAITVLWYDIFLSAVLFSSSSVFVPLYSVLWLL